jgi:uncharacterized membrane protein
VLHQILQWHRMLTDYGNATYPVSSLTHGGGMSASSPSQL